MMGSHRVKVQPPFPLIRLHLVRGSEPCGVGHTTGFGHLRLYLGATTLGSAEEPQLVVVSVDRK